ncbi:hypothetical protein FOMPIDRAFT_1104985, partial [Fomitopsis schrenkii]
NRTIDDVYGDSATGDLPIYGPSLWNIGPPCAGCQLVPDTDKLFMGTWHDNTHLPTVFNNMNITLVGTAIWVYCAVVQGGDARDAINNTNIEFDLDGNPSTFYDNNPAVSDGAPTFGYNVTVFSMTALMNTQHTLVMTMQPKSWMAFDWAQYT